MTNIKQEVREQISKVVKDAIFSCGFEAVEFTVETPRERANGDFSTNAAMMIAKAPKCRQGLLRTSLYLAWTLRRPILTGLTLPARGLLIFT